VFEPYIVRGAPLASEVPAVEPYTVRAADN
jgi:hypothetical protein